MIMMSGPCCWLIVFLLLLILLLLNFSDDVDGFAARSSSNNNNKSRKQQRQSKTITSSGGGGFGSSTSTSTSTSTSATTTNKKKKKKLKKPSQPQLQLPSSYYTADKSQSIQNLMEFLDEEECEGLEITEVGINDNNKLRGIYVTESIQPGEYICAIPFVSTLLIDEQFVEEQESTKDTLLSSSDRIDQGLKFLRKFVNDPEKFILFESYLDCLPEYDNNNNNVDGGGGDPNFDATPEFWSISEIQQLEIPSLVDNMIKRKQDLEMLSEQENLDTSTLKYASWIVRTRAFTTLKKAMTIDGSSEEGLLQRTVLIPYIDLINHSSLEGANAELQVVETKEYDESFYALVAKKGISKGQEIRITYGTGKESTLDIFTKYGFIPDYNQVNDIKLLKQQQDWLPSSIEWKTTLEEDETMLSQLLLEEQQESLSSSQTTTMKTILNLRIYLKRLQLQQQG